MMGNPANVSSVQSQSTSQLREQSRDYVLSPSMCSSFISMPATDDERC
jgi:hypothetical protein